MPYIQATDRAIILAGHPPSKCGELNFLLTMIGMRHAGRDSDLMGKWQDAAKQYVKTKGLSYQTINDVLGAFAGAGFEFRRRLCDKPSGLVEGSRILQRLLNEAAEDFYVQVAASYEDVKIAENGDLPYWP